MGSNGGASANDVARWVAHLVVGEGQRYLGARSADAKSVAGSRGRLRAFGAPGGRGAQKRRGFSPRGHRRKSHKQNHRQPRGLYQGSDKTRGGRGTVARARVGANLVGGFGKKKAQNKDKSRVTVRQVSSESENRKGALLSLRFALAAGRLIVPVCREGGKRKELDLRPRGHCE